MVREVVTENRAIINLVKMQVRVLLEASKPPTNYPSPSPTDFHFPLLPTYLLETIPCFHSFVPSDFTCACRT